MILWIASGELSGDARGLVEGDADRVVVSAASVWEIEIKRALGRLDSPDDLNEMVDRAGFERLVIDFGHAREAGRLPRHHDDPFDRMLVAQARLEGLTLATADEALGAYDVPILTVARS